MSGTLRLATAAGILLSSASAFTAPASMPLRTVAKAGATSRASSVAALRMDAGAGTEKKPEGYGASHTSFYTSAVAKDSYATMDEILEKKVEDEGVRTVITEMLDACVKITEALRVNLVTVADAQNSVFGDVQLGVDVIADELMWEACKSSKVVKEGASEEEPVIVETNKDGRFTVCWDPLDGSSIVDNNWAVGTMIGIWDKETGMLGATGRDQVTSIVVLYGPRTTALVACDDGVYEFTCGAGNKWFASKEKIQIKPESKIFSPANMRAAQESEGYDALLKHWMENRYTLRYSGGLVPDVYQCFTKEMGVFANPTAPKSPAKLRVAFEVAPYGLLVEKAGGKTSDGVTGGSVLDIKIDAVDQRCAACLGSSSEVDRFNNMVLKK